MTKNETENIKPRKKGRRRRNWLTTFAIFALIISAIQVVCYFFAFPLLKEKICESVHIKSNGLYTMNFDGIRINFVGKGFELDNFTLVSDTAVYLKLIDSIDYNKAIYNISVNKLAVKNISVWALLKDDLKINKIILDNPTIRLTGKPKGNADKKKYDAIHNDLYPLLSQWFNSLKIYNIAVKEGYFDFHLRLQDEKQFFEVSKIDINLKNFFLDEKEFLAKHTLFYSEKIELLSENYSIQMADSIHTIKAKSLKINTKDSSIIASGVSMKADGHKSARNNLSNRFNVDLDQIKITGLDINSAYFDKVVDLRSVEISKPQIEFQKGGKVNKSTKKFEAYSSDWYALIKGTMKKIAVDSLIIDSASLKIANRNQPQKATYKSDKIDIKMRGFMLDSLASLNKKKILYSDNIEIQLSDYQMFLPDNKHKLSAENILLSTNSQTVKAEKIKIKPTFTTKDSTEKLINISIPKVEIKDIDIIKAYNLKNYQIGQVKITLPNINTKSFIDSASVNQPKPKTKLFDAIKDEFINSLKINVVNIYQGNINITSKASIKEDSLTISGKLSMVLGNFTINNSTLDGDLLPFKTTNVDINLNDVVMKMPKNYHTLRCKSLNISSKNDRVGIENLEYSCEPDSNFVSTMKRLRKSSILDINIQKAEFTKAELLELLFNQKLKINKLMVSTPQISINLYPELKRIALQNKVVDTLPVVRNISDSIYQLYGGFDKIVVDALQKNFKLVKIDTLATDSSTLSFNFLDTLNNRLAGTSSYFKFNANGFYFDRDSISPDCNFMLAKDYDLDINNFEFMLPDRTHKVKTGNINISTSDSCIVSKLITISNEDFGRRRPKPRVFNVYVPELRLTGVDFKKFGQSGILPSDSLIMPNAVIIMGNNKDASDSVLSNRPKAKREKLIKGLSINNIATQNTTLRSFKGDSEDYFKSQVVSLDVNLSCKDFSLDSANILETGHLVHFSDPLYEVKNFRLNLKDSNIVKAESIAERNDSLSIKDVYFGNPDNDAKNNFRLKELLLTNIDYMEFAFNKRFVANSIKVFDPHLELFKKQRPKGEKSRFEMPNPNFGVIVDTLQISGAKLGFSRPEKRKLEFDNMDFIATGINTEKEHDGDFPADYVMAGITNYTILLKDSINKFNFGRVECFPDKGIVTVKNLDFRPTCNRYDLYKYFDYQKCASYIFAENAVATSFDWKTLVRDKVINIDSLTIDRMSFLSYLNRKPPVDTRVQPTLLGWLARVPARFNVNTTLINNSYLEIEQLNPQASIAGVLTLNNVNGHAFNMSNDSVHIAKRDTMKFDASAQIMNGGHIFGAFTYLMKSPSEEFYCKIMADSINLPTLNPFIENALFAKVNDGMLHKADISFKSDNNASKGESKFVYSNLKIAVNKADSVQEKKRGLITFLANLFVKSKNNRKVGYIYTKRDSTKGFCSYWISSILSGAKATVAFESKEQKDERKLAEKFKDVISRNKQRKERDKINNSSDKKQ